MPPSGARPALPKGDPNSPEALIMDFLAGLTGLPGMGDSQSKSGTVGELASYLTPIPAVSVFAKGIKGPLAKTLRSPKGRDVNEIGLMHETQAGVSNEDLDEALKVLGLFGDISNRQRDRIKAIADQYPSVMAHLIERRRGADLNPRVGVYPEIRSQMGAAGGVDPHPNFPGRSTMGIAPGQLGDPVNTFAEELAHVGQGVGLKEHFVPLYAEANRAGGYGRNPFEVNAKITARKLAPSPLDRVKDLFGMGPQSVKQTPILKQLQDLGVIPRDVQQGQLIEYLRKVGVPPPGATDIEPWSNQFKAIKPPQMRRILDGS